MLAIFARPHCVEPDVKFTSFNGISEQNCKVVSRFGMDYA